MLWTMSFDAYLLGKAATIACDPTSLYIPCMTQNTRPKQKARRPRGAPSLTASVIRVGEGRGFVVEDAERRAGKGFGGDSVVITAAHCLPFFPPCASISLYQHRTYEALLGPIGQDPTVGQNVSLSILSVISQCSVDPMTRSFTTNATPIRH
jgi:hypothetical protein